LQKSNSQVKFKVVETCNQIEAESKTLSAITITLCQNPKDFESSIHMFNHDPSLGQLTIALPVCLGQVFASRFLFGGLTVRMQLENPLIALIAQQTNGRMDPRLTALENAKIMPSPLGVGSTDNSCGG
jgi:hypothetical protein